MNSLYIAAVIYFFNNLTLPNFYRIQTYFLAISPKMFIPIKMRNETFMAQFILILSSVKNKEDFGFNCVSITVLLKQGKLNFLGEFFCNKNVQVF